MDALAEVLQQLLPKGIVFDSPTIYAEVAKLPVVPLEDIHRHWKTYTTTHKNLHDPTACRLEHFWWHVWGSNRRELSGKTLARLWQQIASGPTFVPLRGPPNRWEGPPVKPTRSMHESDTPQPPLTKEPSSQQQYIQAAIPKGTPHNLTPSSARPPPSHPILKKPSGPSSTGPRPTARFADVPDSEGDTSQPSGGKIAQGLNKKKVDTRPTSNPTAPAKVDKKSAATAKKFVVSTTSKRRPVLPRRQSSQSSTGSATGSTTGSTTGQDTAPRDEPSGSKLAINQQGPAPGAKEPSPSKRQGGSGLSTHVKEPALGAKALTRRPMVASPEKQPVSKSSQQPSASQAGLHIISPKQTLSSSLKGSSGKEINSRSQGGSGELRPSAKALGKRPETPVGSGRQSSLRKSSQPGSFDGPGSQPSPPQSGPQPTQTDMSPNGQAEATDGRRDSGLENNPTQKQQIRKASSNTAPTMVRSRSNNESKRLSSASFKSASVVGLSSIAVTGGFDFETPKARPADDDMPPLAADQPDIRAASVLDSRLTPTQPSPAPAPPLGRSKSQLTLLLERERNRIGERARAGSNSSRRSDSSREDGHHEGKNRG